MSDPLFDFLQNSSKTVIPVKVQSQGQTPPGNQGGFFQMLNPMNWLKAQSQSNPELKQVMDVIEQNGGDAKTAFYNECQKRNVNPDEVLKQLDQLKNNPMFQRFMK